MAPPYRVRRRAAFSKPIGIDESGNIPKKPFDKILNGRKGGRTWISDFRKNRN